MNQNSNDQNDSSKKQPAVENTNSTSSDKSNINNTNPDLNSQIPLNAYQFPNFFGVQMQAQNLSQAPLQQQALNLNQVPFGQMPRQVQYQNLNQAPINMLGNPMQMQYQNLSQAPLYQNPFQNFNQAPIQMQQPTMFANFNPGGLLNTNPFSNYVQILQYNDDEEVLLEEIQAETITTTTESQYNLEDLITLQLKLGKNKITPKDSGAIIPLLVSLNVGELKSEKRTSMDLVCVIDKSGSMAGTKIELLKQTFTTIMEYLGEKDRLSVVTFSGSATRITPMICMNAKNKSTTLEQVKLIQADGGTNIGEGVRLALEILKARRYINNVTSVLILSDGLDGGAVPLIRQHLSSLESQIKDTFTFHSFGYGSDHDPELMTEIAKLKNGAFYFIDKLEKVDACFIDCIGGLLSVVAQNIHFTVNSNIDSDFKIVKCYGIEGFWTYSPDNHNYSAKLLQLISGKELDYIFELEMPVLSPMNNVVIANAACELTGLKETNYKQCSFYAESVVNVELEEGEVDASVDPKVLLHYYRLKAAETMNESRKLCDQRKYDQALALLNNLKTTISSSVVKDDSSICAIIKDLQDAIKNAQPQVYAGVGRHYMMENVFANYQQVSNINSNQCYANPMQMRFQPQK